MYEYMYDKYRRYKRDTIMQCMKNMLRNDCKFIRLCVIHIIIVPPLIRNLIRPRPITNDVPSDLPVTSDISGCRSYLPRLPDR